MLLWPEPMTVCTVTDVLCCVGVGGKVTAGVVEVADVEDAVELVEVELVEDEDEELDEDVDDVDVGNAGAEVDDVLDRVLTGGIGLAEVAGRGVGVTEVSVSVNPPG